MSKIPLRERARAAWSLARAARNGDGSAERSLVITYSADTNDKIRRIVRAFGTCVVTIGPQPPAKSPA